MYNNYSKESHDSDTTLREATSYIDAGMTPMPTTKEKVPNFAVLKKLYGTPKWKRFRDTPPTVDEVRDWLAIDPQTNLGIITGAASGGLVVVDFDQAPSFELPDTPTVTTSRGVHLYCRSANAVPSCKFKDGDLLGEGKYVMAPPSTHPSGSQYMWEKSLDDVEVMDLENLRIGELRFVNDGIRLVNKKNISLLGTREQTGSLSLEPPKAEDLAWWDTSEKFVKALIEAIGLSQKALNGGVFRCILPKHGEKRPSANLWRDERGVYVYRDFHERSGERSYCLAELYAAVRSGRLRERGGPELARWKLRALVETGVLPACEVEFPSLPANASAGASILYEGVVLLFQTRWAVDPGAPAPLSRRFAADWCGLSEWRVKGAKEELLQAGVLVDVGEHRDGFLSMRLYLPGTTVGGSSVSSTSPADECVAGSHASAVTTRIPPRDCDREDDYERKVRARLNAKGYDLPPDESITSLVLRGVVPLTVAMFPDEEEDLRDNDNEGGRRDRVRGENLNAQI